eukprot:CAMPEP_0185906162 /NCGR_PEP_ID=MMETSP0196C-20130402/5294_1 /TAXON_ID=2932 /ORGANISM="Alexandrium fundyense, Strain CCMP1719" /LENGTH=66 /DNA_ID=CAMNT_0028625839 /DNA_START=102 /DNA_END=299 /DNA_ORIENTATION=+
MARDKAHRCWVADRPKKKPCSSVEFRYQDVGAWANFPLMLKFGKPEDLDKALACSSIADSFDDGKM